MTDPFEGLKGGSGGRVSHAQRCLKRKAIASLVAAGASCQDAAQQFGVSYTLTLRACREHGVTPRARREFKPVAASTYTVLARLLAGECQHKIARDCGLTRQRVHQIKLRAERAGIDFTRYLSPQGTAE